MSVDPAALAATLLARHRAEDAEIRRRASGIRDRLQIAVVAAIEGGMIARAWLVGSLAWGGFGIRSDVDVVVEGVAAEQAAALWERLSDVIGSPIDLLRLESLTPEFRDRVLRYGIPIGQARGHVA